MLGETTVIFDTCARFLKKERDLTPAETEVNSQLSSSIALLGFRVQIATQHGHYGTKRTLWVV
jgi:hypothetical protein